MLWLVQTVLVLVLIVGAGSTKIEYVEGVKIGFLGDSGAEKSGDNGFYAKAVFDLMQSKGVELVVHNGDYDYYRI